MNGLFEPPNFLPHRWLRGGHLQTIWQLRLAQAEFGETLQHRVDLPDGDCVVLHEDRPDPDRDRRMSVLLLHGLCGCHQSPYMVRLAAQLVSRGITTFRMDMRGCGAARDLVQNIAHAGRSDDVMAAFTKMAQRVPESSLSAVGVSLGGNQLLRAVGRVGSSIDSVPPWWARLKCVAAVSPPIDLFRCSRNMLRLALRPYNSHFIHHLLHRVPEKILQRPEFQAGLRGKRPRTLWELDDRFTAPMSGYRSAEHYYEEASSAKLLANSEISTLILAAENDPIVPVGCFHDLRSALPQSTQLLTPRTGGHVGFVDRAGRSWMDEVLLAWIERH